MEKIIPQNEDEITVAAFERWLKVSRPGEQFVYHRGHLASDREEVQLLPSFGTYVHVYFEPMHTLGTTAWIAYERGQVALAQKKLPGKRGFEYIAFKRRTRR